MPEVSVPPSPLPPQDDAGAPPSPLPIQDDAGAPLDDDDALVQLGRWLSSNSDDAVA